MARLLLLLVAFLVPLASALADPCEDFKTPAQVLNGLKSTGEVARMTARDCGVNSDSAAVRGVVLQNIVVGVNTLSFDVDVNQGDADAAKILERLPSFTASQVKWSEDGRTFEGFGVGDTFGQLHGHLLGESMAVEFDRVYVSAAKPGANLSLTNCGSTLTLRKGGGKLVGSLRCAGLPGRFEISLGI